MLLRSLSPRWAALAISTALPSVSCTAVPTQLLVTLDAEAPLLDQIRQIDLRVWAPDLGQPTYDRSFLLGEPLLEDGTEPSLPLTLPVVPRGGDATRRFELEALSRGEGGAVLGVLRARGGFALNNQSSLSLVFTTACIEARCGARETCRSGVCEDACVSYCDEEPAEPDGPFSSHEGLGRWGTPTVALVPPSELDDDPTLTPDRLGLLFECSSEGVRRVCIAERTEPFGEFGDVRLLLSGADFGDPELDVQGPKIDGDRLFVSTPIASQISNLWVFDWPLQPDAEPRPAEDIAITSGFGNPTFARGGSIAFAQIEARRVIERRFFPGGALTDFSHPDTLNAEGFNRSPSVSPDALTVYFDRGELASLAPRALYVGERATVDAPFRVRLLDELDARGLWESDFSVLPDGRSGVFRRRHPDGETVFLETRR